MNLFEDNRTLRFEGADSSHEGQDASLRIVGRGEWQFDALAYVQARNFSNIVISSTRFVRVLDQRNTPSTGLGGKLEVRPPIGEGVEEVVMDGLLRAPFVAERRGVWFGRRPLEGGSDSQGNK